MGLLLKKKIRNKKESGMESNGMEWNRMEWNAIVHLQRTYNDHHVQLPNHSKASQKLK